MNHKHRPIKNLRRTVCYSHAVAHPGNPKAHGNICDVDTCKCGATRKTNSNGPHIERGHWSAK